MSESTVLAADAGALPTGSAGAHVLGWGGRGWGGAVVYENNRLAAPPFVLGLPSMRCTSTLLSGV